MADRGCLEDGPKRRNSTLPPPCCHCRPPPFRCPTDGCPPAEPCPSVPRCPPPCLPLIWKIPPETPKPKPAICIARPCPQRAGPVPFRFPPKTKISPPPSTVKFAIEYACDGATYYPCYLPGIPNRQSGKHC